MAKLIYASNMSLDGCAEDERGAFDWAPPDDDVFVAITDVMRSAGTYLYGGGQGRLFHDPGRRVNRPHPAGTPLRARRGARPEECCQSRSPRGRSALAAQALKAGLVDGSVGDWAGCAC